MIFGTLAWTIELYMTKYIIGEIFSSGGATLYKDPSDQTVPKAASIVIRVNWSYFFKACYLPVRLRVLGILGNNLRGGFSCNCTMDLNQKK